ncbi:MAG: hypothetical protein LBN74_08630 [Prevotella sp.]|jgi:hypothetical protein|nr:hypothetical protein [Prevotella sp.]
MKKIMKFRIIQLSFVMAMVCVSANAQVTIGSSENPNENVLLDLNQGLNATGTPIAGGTYSNKGFLPPRVALIGIDQIAPLTTTPVAVGTLVYNTTTSVGPATEVDVTPGYYYWGGDYVAATKKGGWIKLQSSASPVWFYMPSIVIAVDVSGNFTRDLYLEYQNQVGTPARTSPGAPAQLAKVYPKSELYFYVLDYDDTVFTAVSINADGELSYTVDADKVTDATFMNIAFAVK